MRGHAATIVAVVFLGLFGWMAASVSRQHSTTSDEIFHVTAGYSYWKLGDFRLQPENGNLPQRWAALPLLWQDVKFPSLDQEAWRTADVALIGHQFFYKCGNDVARMLASARAMVALLGVACGVLVFLWSRSLFGAKGALVSTALFAFCPNLLAHAGVATSDMAACLGFLAAVLTGWRLLHAVTPGRVIALGIAAAVLGLSKFSAPLLVPMLALMALARLLRSSPLPVRLGRWRAWVRGWRAAGVEVAALGVAALLGWTLLWAGYNFRYPGLNAPGAYNRTWDEVMMTNPSVAIATVAAKNLPVMAMSLKPGAIQAVVEPLRKVHGLPEAWLYGLAHVDRFARWRPAFFLGEYGTTGWVAFFPVVFLLKTPLSVFAVLLLAAYGLVQPTQPRRRGRLLYRLTPLAVLIGVYSALMLTSHLNIGHRHLLPVYPALYIAAGAVTLLFARRWALLATLGLLSVHVAASLAIRPDYLAYFNNLHGGPARAYEQFVDSSLDWGQDLPGLKRWLEAHAAGEKVYLSYFGSGSPQADGITATRLADGNFDLETRAVAPPMGGGVYCISATMFQQLYTLVRHGWTPAHEHRYAELRAWADAWYSGRDATTRADAIPRLIELEHLRFGRLCAALHGRTPDAEIGYSILIFRLTDAEVRALLDGPPTYVP